MYYMSLEAGPISSGSHLRPLHSRVEQSPQYSRVEQRPSLCGPASMEMIFKRRGAAVDQLQIAQALNTKVPASLSASYEGLLKVSKDPAKAGTDLDVFVGKRMRKAAERFGVPLEASLYHMDQVPNLPQFLEEHLKAEDDILVNFIDDLNKAQTGLGHYALVSAIEGSQVELCDPWPGNDAFYSANLEALAERMDTIDALGNRRGIVVFSGPKQLHPKSA